MTQSTPLTIAQVSEQLGVCTDTVRMMINRGELAAVHVGRENAKRRTLRIMSDELQSFLRSRNGRKQSQLSTTADMTADSFYASRLVQSAVIRELQIIGKQPV